MKIDEQTVLTFNESEISHLIDAAYFALEAGDIPAPARAFFINLLHGLGLDADDIDDEDGSEPIEEKQAVH